MTSPDGETGELAVAGEEVQAAVVAIMEAGHEAEPDLLASLAGDHPPRALVAAALYLGVVWPLQMWKKPF